LRYNDGREVEPEVMLEFLKALVRQFDGYTPLSKVEGNWFGQEEPSMRFEVWVAPDRIPVLKELVYAIGKRLGQKEMFLIVPEGTRVHRFDIEGQGESGVAENR
jgi:hypothetical protein